MAEHKPKVWIDLDNAPHVPFFAPIVRELEARGYRVWVTARGRYQVSELAMMHGIPHLVIGTRQYGKNLVLKAIGVVQRALALLAQARKEKPDLALSHGSRSQIIAAKLAKIPTVVIIDYEHAIRLPLVRYDCLITPEVIPDSAIPPSCYMLHRKYPGIKEDVYIPSFKPTSGIVASLGIDERNVIVTIRPPATDAHYYRAESEKLFGYVVNRVSQAPETVMVLLPRNKGQEQTMRERWPDLLESGRIVIPKDTLHGLDLIWHSDLVISGGGTMNREAAALGVPVYSIFRGEIGSVDRYLAAEKRMTLIESPQDADRLIKLVKRDRQHQAAFHSNKTLYNIVEHLESVLVGTRRSGRPEVSWSKGT